MSKLLQVDREVSKSRRAALKARPQAEAVRPVTPASQISLPITQPTPPTRQEPRDAAPPSRRSRWANWLVALAIAAGVSVAAFDVWRRLHLHPPAREEPAPAPQPIAQQPQEPTPVQGPSAQADVTNEQRVARGTAREETANVLKLMERALRNAARAVNTAQANSRN